MQENTARLLDDPAELEVLAAALDRAATDKEHFSVTERRVVVRVLRALYDDYPEQHLDEIGDGSGDGLAI